MTPEADPPPRAPVRVATLATDRHGIVTRWPPAAEALLELPERDAVGRPLAEALADRVIGSDEIADRVREGRPLEVIREVGNGSASPRLCQFSVPPWDVRDGEAERVLVVVDITESHRTQRRLRAQYAATRAFAESTTVEEAATRFLSSVGHSIGWHAASLWRVVPTEGLIRPVEFWSADDVDASPFEKATWGTGFRLGEGFPGVVWARNEPMWLPDVTEGDEFERIAAARADGLRAVISFPIRRAGEVVGIVEFFHRERQEPDPELLEAMDAIGSQMGQFMERTRTHEALREEERRLQQALDAGTMGAWEWDVATGEVVWSPHLERIHGLEPGSFSGSFAATMMEVHPEDAERLQETIRRAIEEDQPYHVEYRICRPDGAIRWVEARGEVQRDQEGRPIRMAGLCADVTSRREAEEARDRLLLQAEEAQQRLAFLAQASVVLGSSLRVERTLEKLADLIVPRLADWCSIDMLADGRIQQMALTHQDPQRVEVAKRLREWYPPDLEQDEGLGKVLRTGEPVLYPEISEEVLELTARDEEHLRTLRSLDLGSGMVVPLVARGRVLGAISLVAGSSRRAFEESDLALAQDLARRAAVAVDNARLYEERSAIARTLQRSLLPPSLPEMDGFEVAARYRPAGEGNEVGGDFYDVLERDRDDWIILVGDVCGKGPAAAALTGLTRYTLRAAVMEEPQPSSALRQLNDAVLREESDRFCTATVARVTRRGGRTLVTVSCGGHPLPFLVRGDGEVRSVGRHGTLLGTFPDPALSDETVDLQAGDRVVFYTDGLIEHGGEDTAASPTYLRSLLERCAGSARSADALAECLHEEVTRHNPDGARDDVAIVVLRVKE